MCRDRGLNPGLPAQKSDTLPLNHQVTLCSKPSALNCELSLSTKEAMRLLYFLAAFVRTVYLMLPTSNALIIPRVSVLHVKIKHSLHLIFLVTKFPFTTQTHHNIVKTPLLGVPSPSHGLQESYDSRPIPSLESYRGTRQGDSIGLRVKEPPRRLRGSNLVYNERAGFITSRNLRRMIREAVYTWRQGVLSYDSVRRQQTSRNSCVIVEESVTVDRRPFAASELHELAKF
uniref:Uncharacterized protein n=1 Tax=Timema bartmani TaxID=61472 RepID=A0A7R9ENW5_9NEOP|nr:unnamed protein product [Timema bartmani]